MKQAFNVLVFACAGLCCGVTSWAQERAPTQGLVQPDVTFYRGTNDAPSIPGSEHVGGDTFLAGTQGNRIFVVAQPDTCGRMFYLKGTINIRPNFETGSISGTMWRCTNSVLLGPPCNQKKNYQVQFTGTVTKTRAPRTGLRQLQISIDYFPDEKWIKETCKKARVDKGSDMLVLNDAPQYQRPPTGRIIRDDMDQAEKLAIDTIVQSFENRPK